MDDLREPYQTTILDHNRSPRNFGALEGADRSADGHNPLCGDQIQVQVVVDGDDVVQGVGFTGQGCAISTASASLMTQAVKGKKLAEIETLFEGFHALVTSDPREEPDASHLGKLEVFAGVREFPMRVKCATLCWHTLRSALAGGDTVTTE